MFQSETYQVSVRQVLQAFEMGEPTSIEPLGGTATPKFAVATAMGPFVVRVRPREFAEQRLVRFDHAALVRLARQGLPVPSPRQRPDGTTWLHLNGEVVEVLSWVEGEPFVWDDLTAVRNLGAFMARFHAALAGDVPDGKEDFPREDDPDLMTPYVDQLENLCRSAAQREQMAGIRYQLGMVRRELDRKRWPTLPMAVIHGDIHTGNVRFQNSEVSAVYDFDYLSLQARVRDVCDALMFFAAGRDQPVDPDDIITLTAPYCLDVDRAVVLLEGYQQTISLTAAEWEAIPWILRSQWCQMRLRGSRKVPENDKVSYVLDRFFEQIDWLENSAPTLVSAVQTKLRPLAGRSGTHEILQRPESRD
jgi:Ser/Thr protein kinase RdoA (MazF antagonist)